MPMTVEHGGRYRLISLFYQNPKVEKISKMHSSGENPINMQSIMEEHIACAQGQLWGKIRGQARFMG
jgi:hypothetical protein